MHQDPTLDNSPDGDHARKAHQQAEDALLGALLCLRGMHLLQGVVSTATAWRAYRRPYLATVTLVVSAAESAWLARRCWSRHSVNDPTAVWADATVGVGGLLALRAATSGADCTTWMNWMCPITLDTAAAAATALPRRDASIVTGAIAGTFLVSVSKSVAADRSVLTTVVASGLAYLGFFAAGDRFARHLRSSAVAIEQARDDAVQRSERFALERERVRQHRLISRSALEALDLVADGWSSEADDNMRARVRREAARLRSALGRTIDDAPAGLASALREITQDVAAGGLGVELLLSELDTEPNTATAIALTEATREALDNVARHAGVSRAVVRATSTRDHIEITVRDHGRGCDPRQLASSLDGHGGIATRIVRPIREIGGSAEMHSEPERGMLVTLRVTSRSH